MSPLCSDFQCCGQSPPLSSSARMSAAAHTAVLGANLRGAGYLPARIPAYHCVRDTGMSGWIAGRGVRGPFPRRRFAAASSGVTSRWPIICGKRRYPISGNCVGWIVCPADPQRRPETEGVASRVILRNLHFKFECHDSP